MEPPITVQAVHRSGGNNVPPSRVVIHTTSPPGESGTSSSSAGQAHATALYFTSTLSGGSAHYIVDVGAEEHCMADNAIAWHAPPNAHSIGIEICGEPTYSRATWLCPSVWPAVVRAALRCRELCDRHGVPKDRIGYLDLLAGKHGVCGHVDVSRAWHQSDHTDPGPNFPWDQFMAVVNPPVNLPSPTLPPGTAWEYQEAQVRTSLVLVGPLDPQGRGYGDWYPGLPSAPVVVGTTRQGPDPAPGSADANTGDPYWEGQGAYTVSASTRGMAVRVVVTHGVPGQTVGVYVSAA